MSSDKKAEGRPMNSDPLTQTAHALGLVDAACRRGQPPPVDTVRRARMVAAFEDLRADLKRSLADIEANLRYLKGEQE